MVKLYANHSQGYIKKERINRGAEYIGKWKVFVPEAVGSGKTATDVMKPILGEPEAASTETYVMNGPYADRQEAENVISYINTKFFHFMIGLKKSHSIRPIRSISSSPCRISNVRGRMKICTQNMG